MSRRRELYFEVALCFHGFSILLDQAVPREFLHTLVYVVPLLHPQRIEPKQRRQNRGNQKIRGCQRRVRVLIATWYLRFHDYSEGNSLRQASKRSRIFPTSMFSRSTAEKTPFASLRTDSICQKYPRFLHPCRLPIGWRPARRNSQKSRCPGTHPPPRLSCASSRRRSAPPAPNPE